MKVPSAAERGFLPGAGGSDGGDYGRLPKLQPLLRLQNMGL